MAKRKLTDTYSRTVVLQYKDGKSIVHFPDLTPEEYERRHKQLEQAAINMMIEVEKAKEKQKII